MNKDLTNIEIVPARDEHMEGIKTTLKDFYLDEPIFKAQRIDVEKLNESFYGYRTDDVPIVAIDKNNGAVAAVIINSIIKSDGVIRLNNNAGKWNYFQNIIRKKR